MKNIKRKLRIFKIIIKKSNAENSETKEKMERQQKFLKISNKRCYIQSKKVKLQKNVMKSIYQVAAKDLNKFINRPSTSGIDKNNSLQ